MTVNVASWAEASAALERVVAGRPYTLGSGYDYPSPLAVFTMDALSGEGMGYLVWETEDGRPRRLVARINVGRI